MLLSINREQLIIGNKPNDTSNKYFGGRTNISGLSKNFMLLSGKGSIVSIDPGRKCPELTALCDMENEPEITSITRQS